MVDGFEAIKRKLAACVAGSRHRLPSSTIEHKRERVSKDAECELTPHARPYTRLYLL